MHACWLPCSHNPIVIVKSLAENPYAHMGLNSRHTINFVVVQVHISTSSLGVSLVKTFLRNIDFVTMA